MLSFSALNLSAIMLSQSMFAISCLSAMVASVGTPNRSNQMFTYAQSQRLTELEGLIDDNVQLDSQDWAEYTELLIQEEQAFMGSETEQH
jgi:hypothetical protein